MLKLRFAHTALIGVLGLFAAAAAHAGSYELGTLTSTPTALTESVSQGSFSDDVNFTITAPNTFAFASTQNAALSYTVPGTNTNISVLNINNLSESLYGIGSNGSTQLLGPVSSGSTLSDTLAPGNYFFNLTGDATGSAGGQYVVTAAAVPVPEPADATLLAVGLGLVGLIALRKKQRV